MQKSIMLLKQTDWKENGEKEKMNVRLDKWLHVEVALELKDVAGESNEYKNRIAGLFHI